ncbi:hypothetical protein [Campylobacter hyointestinalis]|uniref:hypothetical protein n=1 Tax=Campylobacter hyointestinalis TaxID=198 RepID=UPI000DCBE793|nr:hypothetical protein [Campylobacter hyointestinalis]RAZ57439.1 hypothetical protein CHL10074_00340 [Campylobacter hyointestinalis subsp. lawsonii]RAZ64994.1 hypothetical protein CHL9767_02005 [Campylobacter hyointestinalis subsp. lawsonii]
MTSINIQTANSSIIDAIKAIIALDPETTISYDDEPSLSAADIRDLKQIVQADKRGEIKYTPFEEFKTEMRAYVKSIG